MRDEVVVFQCQTKHGQYEVVDTLYNSRPARILYAGKRTSAQSGLALDDKPELLFDYNQRLLELLEGLQPARVLLVGGGALTFPKALVERWPDLQLDVVEIDADLIGIGERHFGFTKGKYTAIFVMDGLQFLETSTGGYDVILLDVFSQTTVPAAFQTSKFAHLLQRNLTQNGVVAMNIIASYYGERSQVLRRQIVSFELAFPTVTLFPAGYGLSLWLPQNFILTAQLGSRDLQTQMRYAALSLPHNSDDDTPNTK